MRESSAKDTIKSVMQSLEINSEDLATLLTRSGYSETRSSIDSKISRGSFSAEFFLRCLNVMNVEQLDVCQPAPISDLPEVDNALDVPTPNRFKDLHSGIEYVLPKSRKPKRRFKLVSLFSGAGGFDLGLEEAGFDTVACIDFDEDCRETLSRNRPKWLVVDSDAYEKKHGKADRSKGDIRSISTDEVMNAAKLQQGDVDLIVGGAPCQPFSNMGKKKGKNDEQNGDLFLHFVRFVREMKPKAFIFENVVGITQGRHRDVISYMKEQFSDMDYGIAHAVLNSANYGVPQRRERFFLVGIQGSPSPAFPLPSHFKNAPAWTAFTSGFDVQPKKKPKAWVTVHDAFSKLPHDRNKRSDYACMKISDVVSHRMKFISPGENFKVVPKEHLPNCWKSGKHLGSDTFGRLVPEQPSVTIRTAAYNPSKGRYIHPFEDRGLDTIEMACLQDFPADWKFYCKGKSKVTLVSAGKQIGNAVPPGLAKALGQAIAFQLAEETCS